MRGKRTRRHHLRLSEAAPGRWRAERETGDSHFRTTRPLWPQQKQQFADFHKILCGLAQGFRTGVVNRAEHQQPSVELGSSCNEQRAEHHLPLLAYLLEPHAVSVGQDVQPVLPLRLLHPLAGGIRVVAAFPTTFQHPPAAYSLVPILPEH